MRCALARGAGPLGALIALSFLAAPDAAAATIGKQRILTVLVSYGGARPFARDEMAQALRSADAYVRRSSFGRLQLDSNVTAWLDGGPFAPSCFAIRSILPDQLISAARAVARGAGYNPADYDRVVYDVAGSSCYFQGAAAGSEVLLTGRADLDVIVHELGHTWGLPHAAAAERCATFCVTQQEGDPITPMGIGFVDFSAYEKELLGWIERQPRITKAGRYAITSAGVRRGLHALVFDASSGQYWIEQRPDRTSPAVTVRIVHPEVDFGSAATSTFLLGPIRPGHATITPGQTFSVPGAFSVKLGVGTKTPAQLRVRLPASSG